MHADAALCERQRDAAGADAELERRAVAGEGGDEVDDGVDRRGLGHLVVGIVVPRRDVLTEVVRGHPLGHCAHRPDHQPSGRARAAPLPR